MALSNLFITLCAVSQIRGPGGDVEGVEGVEGRKKALGPGRRLKQRKTRRGEIVKEPIITASSTIKQSIFGPLHFNQKRVLQRKSI